MISSQSILLMVNSANFKVVMWYVSEKKSCNVDWKEDRLAVDYFALMYVS